MDKILFRFKAGKTAAEQKRFTIMVVVGHVSTTGSSFDTIAEARKHIPTGAEDSYRIYDRQKEKFWGWY